MDYIEVQIINSADFTEILTAELAQLGYESFLDTDVGFNAYILENLFEKDSLEALKVQYEPQITFAYDWKTIETQNWNAIWESEYEPVIVANSLIIKSTFHQIEEKYPFEIIINPKMSFGTGHHETTTLMIEQQLEIDHQGKKVLDAGSGTGILAIMAVKLGASKVDANDIDEWAVENSQENIQLNNCPQITVYQGDINVIPLPGKYDIILANINKNVLLSEIPAYQQYLTEKGVLVLSGFYTEDEVDIDKKAQENNLKLMHKKIKNNWLSLRFEKIM